MLPDVLVRVRAERPFSAVPPADPMSGDLHFLSIDPGDKHQGVAYATARLDPKPQLYVHWTRDLLPEQLESLLETADVSGWVVEAWHLMPNMARSQGYSTFPTVEVIGVCKYLAKKRGLTCTMQPASMKRDGRRIGERLCPGSGGVRRIQTTQGPRTVWDWNRRTQHERDALSHAAVWAFTNESSPLYEYDLKRRAEICL